MKYILSESELHIIYFFNVNKKERTRNAYKRELDKLKIFTSKPILNTSAFDIETYIAKLSESKAPTTVRRTYDQLNSFFGYCFKEGYISSNPCYKVKKPHASKKVKLERTPSPDDLRSILNILKEEFSPRDYSLAVLILTCGLRIGEALNVKWQDFAYTEEGCFLKIESNTPGITYLYIYDFVLKALNDYREKYQIPDDYLNLPYYTFISNRQMKGYLDKPEDCTPLTADWFRKVMEDVCTRAETPLYTAKDLRHAFAVYAVNTGVNKNINRKLVVENVARQMGLSSSAQMSKYNGLIQHLVVPSGDYAKEFFNKLIN